MRFIKLFPLIDSSTIGFDSDDANFDAMVESFAASNSLTSSNLDGSLRSDRLFEFPSDAIRVNTSISTLSLSHFRIDK